MLLRGGVSLLLKRLGVYGGLVVIDKNKANITPGLKRAEYSRYPCFLYDFNEIKGLSGDEFIALLKRDFKNLQKIGRQIGRASCRERV